MTGPGGLPEWARDLPPEVREAIAQAAGRARQLSELAAGPAAEEAAQLAAWGLHPVTVVYGTIETLAAEQAVNALAEIAETAGHAASSRGGSDYRTWYFEGPGADGAVVRFIAAASAIAAPYWRITPTARPVYR